MTTYLICPSVLVSGVWTLDCEEWSEISAPLLWWRGKPSVPRTWCKRWKRESWIRALSTRTCCGSLGSDFEAEWISSLEEYPANRSRLLEVAKPPKTSDTSGPTSSQGCLFSETESASSRTSMESPLPNHPDITQFSTMSSATWKEWVSEQRQDSSQRRKLAHRTCESDGSSLAWPTPTPIHATRGNHDEPVEKYQKRVRDYEEGRAKGKPGKSLGVAVNWPTPTTQDAANNGGPAQKRRNTLPLNAEVTQHPQDHSSSTGSQGELLNPSWVDTLMGFPIGWTDLEPWGTR